MTMSSVGEWIDQAIETVFEFVREYIPGIDLTSLLIGVMVTAAIVALLSRRSRKKKEAQQSLLTPSPPAPQPSRPEGVRKVMPGPIPAPQPQVSEEEAVAPEPEAIQAPEEHVEPTAVAPEKHETSLPLVGQATMRIQITMILPAEITGSFEVDGKGKK